MKTPLVSGIAVATRVVPEKHFATAPCDIGIVVESPSEGSNVMSSKLPKKEDATLTNGDVNQYAPSVI
jgi:hypothetical protein